MKKLLFILSLSFLVSCSNDSSDDIDARAVDLGLPSGTLWACCNVGASSPEEYGDYFAWGETTPKDSYTQENSATYRLSISELESKGIIGSDGNLTAAYDAATVNMGKAWRMPTHEEINELLDECSWTWTTQNGVNGCRATGPNGNSIFLPAAGDIAGEDDIYDVGERCDYWSATLQSDIYYAYCFYYYDPDDGLGYGLGDGKLWFGCSVRPVLK